MRNKTRYLIITCLALAIAVLLLSSGCSALSKPDNANAQLANTIPQDTAQPEPADEPAVFHGFILAASPSKDENIDLSEYITKEGDMLATEPGSEETFKYALVMSSVPGLPVTVLITDEDRENFDIDTINITVDEGELLYWDSETGKVSTREKSVTVNVRETIYWSPLSGTDSATAPGAVISIEALSGGNAIASQSLNITKGEDDFYYATAGELELD